MPEFDQSTSRFVDLAAEILTSGQPLNFRTHGGSMRPLIRDGDMLSVQQVGLGDIRRGDILLYKSVSSQLLVHRVIKIQRCSDQNCYLMQGDALLQPDGWIPPNQILGQVTSIDRNGRIVIFRSPIQRCLATLLVVSLPILKLLFRRIY